MDLVREFIAQWDGMNSGGQVWVIGATNNHDRLDPAVVSRFGPAVEIGLPGAAERRQILQLEMKKLEHDEEVPEFAGASTVGFAGRDLKLVAKGVYNLAVRGKSAVTPEMWKEVIGSYRDSSGPKWMRMPDGALWC
jgi:AAA+ superfamily predicted ATPase